MSDEQQHWKKLGTRMVDVDNIYIVDRIIQPTEAQANAMAKSLSSQGQLQPILVTKYRFSAWKVVAGATRLLAAKQLGWAQIEATIIGADTDIEYQLIEIAENLDRHDLSESERELLKKKDKELRAARLKHFEELVQPKQSESPTGAAKGGRGKKGGIREAARKARVPEPTARRQLKKATAEKLRQNEERRSLAQQPNVAAADRSEQASTGSNAADQEWQRTVEELTEQHRGGLTPEEWALAQKTTPAAAKRLLISTIRERNRLRDEMAARRDDKTDAGREARDVIDLCCDFSLEITRVADKLSEGDRLEFVTYLRGRLDQIEKGQLYEEMPPWMIKPSGHA